MAPTTERERFPSLSPLFSLVVLTVGACHTPAEPEGHMLGVNWGESEIDPDDALDKTTTRLGVAYRFGEHTRWGLIPSLGVTVGNDDSVFLMAEIRKNLWLAENWVLTPSSGFGYFEDGDVLRLGGEFEFRSGAELSYQFPGGMRLGVAFYHISNAGFYEVNPGTNEMLISWTVPIGRGG